MKLLILSPGIALAFSACVSTTVTSTTPDGKTVTTKTTSQDPDVIKAIASGIAQGVTIGVGQELKSQGFAK